MVRLYRAAAVAAVLLLAPASLFAQRSEVARSESFQAERSLVESVLHTVLTVVQDVTLQHEAPDVTERLQQMARRLHAVTPDGLPDGLAGGAYEGGTPPPPATVSRQDLRRLESMLRGLADDVDELRARRVEAGEVEAADELARLYDRLLEAARLTSRLAEGEAAPAREGEEDEGFEEQDEWLAPGRYDGDRAEPVEPWDDEDDDEDRDRRWHVDVDWGDDREHDDDRDRRRDRFAHPRPAAYVGDLPGRWPYRETALYRPIPSIRYNRVEGLVLGFGLRPLEWDDYERSKLVGQAAYAFALEDWRFEVGAETMPFRSRDGYALKLGGSYFQNTATDDLWKSNWVENSLAAFFFENDFFDYYQVEGWTLYAVQQLSPALQASAGFRQEAHAPLQRNTGYSFFGDGEQRFRLNPLADSTDLNSFVFALEGGSVADFRYLPRGLAFRLEAEIADGLGNDFLYNRYVGDVRAYLPVSRYSTLALRLRGGFTAGEAPLQRRFTLGGLGSVRGYPQNVFWGSRMLLGNAEYAFEDIDLLADLVEDVQLFGFADLGWVNDVQNRLDTADLIPSAGLGVGLDDRTVRLELAFPLRDLGYGLEPSLWFRLSPSF